MYVQEKGNHAARQAGIRQHFLEALSHQLNPARGLKIQYKDLGSMFVIYYWTLQMTLGMR